MFYAWATKSTSICNSFDTDIMINVHPCKNSFEFKDTSLWINHIFDKNHDEFRQEFAYPEVITAFIINVWKMVSFG